MYDFFYINIYKVPNLLKLLITNDFVVREGVPAFASAPYIINPPDAYGMQIPGETEFYYFS